MTIRILTMITLLAALAICPACGGGRPAPPDPLPDQTVRPVSKMNLRIGLSFDGIPLRSMSAVSGVDPDKVELTMLELKQGGRLIFPHDDPNWYWYGSVLPLANREWIVSELSPGSSMVLQIRFAPAYDVDSGAGLPLDSPYRALLRVPVTVPQDNLSRCDIDIRMRYDRQVGYMAETRVGFS